MTPEERLAHEIREWRKTWGMSQAWLAGKASTTQRVISLLEAGKYNPTLELLERLAMAMDMRLDVAFRPQAR
jgi:HTH-type transcriptional regulator/antitoxin HipB